MLALFLKYKKYIAGVILALVVVLCFNWYVDSKEKVAYKEGFESANVQWEKKGRQYVGMIEEAHSRNQALNYTLTLLSEGKLIEEQKNRDNVINQQLEYSKSPESKVKGLDDKFIKLYNDSLGG